MTEYSFVVRFEHEVSHVWNNWEPARIKLQPIQQSEVAVQWEIASPQLERSDFDSFARTGKLRTTGWCNILWENLRRIIRSASTLQPYLPTPTQPYAYCVSCFRLSHWYSWLVNIRWDVASFSSCSPDDTAINSTNTNLISSQTDLVCQNTLCFT